MIGADILAVIIVVLQSNFGELAGVIRQRGRNSPASVPIRVRAERRVVPGDIVATERSDPSFAEAIRNLRVESPIAEGLRWQGWIIHVAGEAPRLVAPVHPFR